ncbi:MAG: FadR family transcriptional regulator [Deltaproteobacteria bacterium]|nr:FadR family transcriptional regulator [Deltaproteobacteria bacterium]
MVSINNDTTHNLFGTFEREIISEKIVARILTLIKERQLRPGDRLPPERELAQMMGVSRPSLREALRALQIMNIIENRQGSGHYITSLEPERLVEHFDIVFALDDSTYLELFQARRILETGIAEQAAMNITEEEIAELERHVSEAEKLLDDAEAFLQADLDLHNAILRTSKNRILKLFMRSVNQLSVYSRRRTGDFPEIRRQTIQDHRTIVQALKSRDPQKARAAMLQHLSHVEHKLREIIEPERMEGG